MQNHYVQHHNRCCSKDECWYPLHYGYSVTDKAACGPPVVWNQQDAMASGIADESGPCDKDVWCTFKQEYSGLYIFVILVIACCVVVPCFMRFLRNRNRNRGLALGFDGLTGSTTELPTVAPKSTCFTFFFHFAFVKITLFFICFC